MKRLVFRLLITLCIYGSFAVGLPLFFVQTSPNSFDEDGQLIQVQSLGRFAYGQFSTIDYHLLEDGEAVTEMNSMSLFLGKNMWIRTERQESGIYAITWVISGNRAYEKTLRDHPEILTEAEKVLQLGRDKFAKAKKKLEEQKSKPNQSDRLG